jgi:hypothetical protein
MSVQDLASRGDQLQVEQKQTARMPTATANALALVEPVGSHDRIGSAQRLKLV